MKVRITLKDPDGFYECCVDAAEESVASISGLSGQEKKELREIRLAEIQESLEKWVSYNEYLTVEFDTEARTATVLSHR